MDLVKTTLSVAGLITVIRFSGTVFKFVRHLWNESLWSETFNFKKFGAWAVVTGASDGIGKATAFELAKCGMNVVVISRTQSKLDKFAAELRDLFNVRVIAFAIDFTSDESIYDVINEDLRDLDIALLVNNVGVAFAKPVMLMDVPNHKKYATDVINVNVVAMLKMTEIVLPNMVKKGGGIITNLSSIFGSAGSPYYTMYGASKSTIITYTKAMAQEYKSKGIIFQCLMPAITFTPMTEKFDASLRPSFIVPDAERYGKYVIKSLGKSVYTNTSFLAHNLFQLILWLIPDFLLAKALKMGAKNNPVPVQE